MDELEPSSSNVNLATHFENCEFLPSPSEPRPSTSKSIVGSPSPDSSSKMWQNYGETFGAKSDDDEWIEASKKRNNVSL